MAGTKFDQIFLSRNSLRLLWLPDGGRNLVHSFEKIIETSHDGSMGLEYLQILWLIFMVNLGRNTSPVYGSMGSGTLQ